MTYGVHMGEGFDRAPPFQPLLDRAPPPLNPSRPTAAAPGHPRRPMSKAEVYNSVWIVVQALVAEYAGEWGIPLPTDVPGTDGYAEVIRQLQELEMEHAVGGKYGRTWRGQIGSIDGCIVSPFAFSPNLLVCV